MIKLLSYDFVVIGSNYGNSLAMQGKATYNRSNVVRSFSGTSHWRELRTPGYPLQWYTKSRRNLDTSQGKPAPNNIVEMHRNRPTCKIYPLRYPARKRSPI